MLYSTRSAPAPQMFVFEIIFTEPMFLLLILLIPMGLYLLKKEFRQAKIIGRASVLFGCIYTFSRIIYYIF